MVCSTNRHKAITGTLLCMVESVSSHILGTYATYQGRQLWAAEGQESLGLGWGVEPSHVYRQFYFCQNLTVFFAPFHHQLTSTPQTLSISWASSGDGPMWRLAKDSSGGKTSLSRSWRACADSESVLRQCGADKNRGSLLAARKANISTVSLVTCASYA